MEQPAREDVRARLRAFLIEELATIAELTRARVSEHTVLVGQGAVVDSRELVELLLALEDHAERELGLTFDWRSDGAMSAAWSALRTIGTLADHVARSAERPA